MKGHQIAILVNDVTAELKRQFPTLPQMTRAIVSSAVMDSLFKQGLLEHSSVKQYKKDM